MIRITIYGTGCSKCIKQVEYAHQAAKDAGVEVEIDKVEDINQIVAAGVMLTPAVAINGSMVISGQLMPPATLEDLLRKAGQSA